MSRPFHETIGRIVEDAIGKRNVIRSDHCGGGQRVPLYCHEPTHEERYGSLQYSQVDLLILADNKVKGVVEIEEAGEDTEPKKLFGNFLASALSKCFIAGSRSRPVYMGESVLFVQVLDTSGLNKDKTRSGRYKTTKFDQWENVENSINDIIPAICSKVKTCKLTYKLFSGELSDFQKGGARWSEFTEAIKAII